mmetsp:Transcript_32019/g.58801  ORF Transcript_32019/g.58801 Transcript_32019/m.58801 type:complete len:253 (-) Transcript_32019:521-1279(-)
MATNSPVTQSGRPQVSAQGLPACSPDKPSTPRHDPEPRHPRQRPRGHVSARPLPHRHPGRAAAGRPTVQCRTRPAHRPVCGADLAARQMAGGARLHHRLPRRAGPPQDRPRRAGLCARRRRAQRRRRHPGAGGRDPPAAGGHRLPLHLGRRNLRAAGDGHRPGCLLALLDQHPAEAAQCERHPHQLLARRGQGRGRAAAGASEGLRRAPPGRGASGAPPGRSPTAAQRASPDTPTGRLRVRLAGWRHRASIV